ncbi:MAG: multidrug effflux MFS transporter [Alphaproteobacteria bacterium]|nr:multidrug effflux MFS transporter [Alphaproteobacteria bacterium]
MPNHPPMPMPIVLLVVSIGLIGIFSNDSFIPAMPAIAEAFQISAGQAQAGLASSLLGFGIGPLFFGMAADRWGRKIPLLVGIGLFLLSSLLAIIAPSAHWIVICRFFQGLGGSCIGISRAIGRDVFDGAALTRFMALAGIIAALGSSLAWLMGSMMVAWFGWPASFWLHAGFSLLLWVLILRFLPETLPPDHRQHVNWHQQWVAIRQVVSHRQARGYALLSSAGIGGAIAFTSHLPFWFKQFAIPPSRYGYYAMLLPLGYFIGNVVSEFGKTLPPRLMLRFGMAIILLTTGLLVMGHLSNSLTPWLMVLLGSSYMAGNGFLLPIAGAGVVHPFPHCAGVASALYSLFMMAGATITIAGLGWLFDNQTLPTLVAMAAIPLAGYGYCGWCQRRLR